MKPVRKACCLSGVGVFALCVATVLPVLIEHMKTKGIAAQVVIDPSSDQFARWLHDESDQTDSFLVYNVTNPEAIVAGARPVVKVLGPFVYKTITDRIDPQFDAGTSTVSFFERTSYKFDAEATRAATNGAHESDEFVLTAVNVQLEGVIQQALASDNVTKMGLGNVIYNDGNGDDDDPLPSCCIRVNGTGGAGNPAKRPGACFAENVCAVQPPAVSDWAGSGDDTGTFVKISVHDLIFGYENSTLMAVVNRVSARLQLPIQPTFGTAITKNMSLADARDGRTVAHTGATDIALAGQLVQYNGRSDIYGCLGSPCNRSQMVPGWATHEANAVEGSSEGMQFAPARLGAPAEGGTNHVLVKQLYRKIEVTNRREPNAGAGETMVVKDIPLLKYTYTPHFWQQDADYWDTQQGMLNESHVYQRASIRVTRPGFMGFVPSPPSPADDSTAPVTAEFINPQFFASTAAADGSTWDEESYFGIEPQTGKTMSTHNRFQISMQMQTNDLTTEIGGPGNSPQPYMMLPHACC
jgi:hypothetical protein